MKQSTHIAFAVGVVAASVALLDLSLCCSLAALASAVFVNFVVDRFGHERRGRFVARSAWSHSIVFVAAATLVTLYPFMVLWGCSTGTLLAALAGSLSHLPLDAITPAGIAPFWPLSRKRVRGAVRYDNGLANTLFTTLGAILVTASILHVIGIKI